MMFRLDIFIILLKEVINVGGETFIAKKVLLLSTLNLEDLQP